MIHQLALVSEISDVTSRALTRTAAALQKQVARDFAPMWNVQATVDAFDELEDVPLGYWPIIVVADVQGAAGYHTDKNGQPFSLVEFGDSWSLTASHECLEMLGDPFGNRLVAGQSRKPGQGRVEFLVEVCDPSEDDDFAYRVNNILVSDFYTPAFFDPVKAANVRYSYVGAITEPRQVLKGGYLSWHNPVDDHWYQETWFGGAKSQFRDLGVFAKDGRSLREQVDAATPQTKRLAHLAPEAPTLMAAVASFDEAAKSTESRAESWREQITALKASAPPLDY